MTTPKSGVYSFIDVQATFKGPGGTFDIASAGVAEEAIRLDMVADKNVMTIGANGDGMHSLRASRAGRVTMQLLKTAAANALLSQVYNHQSQSSANWGQNQITITNPVTGDNITCQQGAFVRQSPIGFASEGGVNTWVFEFVVVDEILGNGFQNTGL
jgi:gentisate 1,2-dioxygenase